MKKILLFMLISLFANAEFRELNYNGKVYLFENTSGALFMKYGNEIVMKLDTFNKELILGNVLDIKFKNEKGKTYDYNCLIDEYGTSFTTKIEPKLRTFISQSEKLSIVYTNDDGVKREIPLDRKTLLLYKLK